MRHIMHQGLTWGLFLWSAWAAYQQIWQLAYYLVWAAAFVQMDDFFGGGGPKAA